MSNPRVNRFFSVFDQSVQTEIINFCKRITKSHSDVYIFMARKAASFCDCLEELGLIHLDGYVTTDRVLDIDGKWLAGKKIVIIDDAVVSGTTLYKTIKKLEEFNVGSIEVHILTVNEKWYNPELLQDDKHNSYVYPIYNNLPDNLCIKLCNDIVRSISIVPRPYDIDFPLYKSFDIPEFELNRFLVLNNWEAYDLRTELQKENNIINFTLIPNEYELKKFSSLLGINLVQNCIVKIRIYGRLKNKEKKIFSIRVSPVVVFEEMETKRIQKMFNRIISEKNDKETEIFLNWNASSQLRFLQFYYSNALANFWRTRINHLLSKPFELIYSYRNLSFLFPESCISAVQSLCQILVKQLDNIQFNNKLMLDDGAQNSIYQSVDPISLNARLYEPFINMYHEKELPCRELVLKEGKKVFLDEKYRELTERLNEGISYQKLVNRIRDAVECYDIEKKVSLFIDYSIDAGIIVPIIQQVENKIFRAYRHGEDVLFGHREEMMYTKMLSLFLQYSGSKNGITRLSAEKLIVLFSKIGLRAKILQPYTSNFFTNPVDSQGNAMKILRIKPYLKGPIALVGTALQHQKNKNIPYITNERKALWLTYLLIQNGCLTSNDVKGKYDISTQRVEKDIKLFTDEERDFIANFAELVGRISNPQEDTGVCFDDNDWAKISTTLTLPDTVNAVAAEMEIFYNNFDISDLVTLCHNKELDAKAIKYFASGFSFESIHNAIMKIESFNEKKGQKLIQSVKFPSSIEQRTWLGYFSDELNNNSDENNEYLSVVFYEQQIWAYVLMAIVNELFILFVNRYELSYNKKATSKDKFSRACLRMKEAKEKIEELRKKIPQQAKDAAKILCVYDAIVDNDLFANDDTEDFNIKITTLINSIDNIEIVVSNIKENVCDILGEKGKLNEILRYNYAVHINLSGCTDEEETMAYSIIESAYKKEIDKIERKRKTLISTGNPIPYIRFDELPQKYKPEPISDGQSPGVWYIANGTNIDEQVVSFAMNAFYKLYINNLDCQVTIFDSLSYDTCIKSSSEKYAEYHCNQFNSFIEYFKKDVLFPLTRQGVVLRHVCANKLLETSKIKNIIQGTTFYEANGDFEINETAITKEPYTVTNYSCTRERRIIMEQQTYDFGIITILPEELNSIKNIFGLQKVESNFGERYYYSGYVDVAGKSKSVICTQAVSQGESSAINAYKDLTQKYHPRVVFLVGIAGGILTNCNASENSAERLELDLCDVVIAKSVIDYEMRKETEEGVEHRGQCFNIDVSAATVINDFLTDLQSQKLVSVDGSKNPSINVVFDAIGSGNAVIANKLSSVTKWLKEVNSKVAAVEMEATGVSCSFYEDALASRDVKALIIVRGISDMADVEKSLCKKYRNPAAQNAALVAKKIIEKFPCF